jgi:NADPH2:quinone reductase
MRAVRYDRFTGIDGLDIVERPDPVATPGTVVVKVMASSINPATLSAVNGAPYVPGRDVAGTIVATGGDTGGDSGGLAVGDAVLGRVQDWWAHAELVAVPAAQLIPKPTGLSWDVAGSLYTPAMAALAGVKAVAPATGELVVVSGASGGVGLTAAQLARHRGASVIGLASASKLDWLTKHDITGITYGEGQKERILHAAGPRRIDGFIDTGGTGNVALALDLGIAPPRVNTVVDFTTAKQHGISTLGTDSAGGPAAFTELATLASDGTLDFPIAATYPLAEVRAAYRDIAEHRPFGRIVLHPQE